MGTISSELRPIAADLTDAPRVYVDANFPLGAVTFMRRTLGWDVLFVLEHADLRRAPDRRHFARALELGRTLVTLDRDFFDAARFPPEHSPGVVVCSAPDELRLTRLLADLDARLRAAPGAMLPLRGQILEVPPARGTPTAFPPSR